MLLKEAWQRKGNFLLSVLAVALATGLFVGLYTLNLAAVTETTRAMKSLGFNLLIVHKDTSMSHFYANDYADRDMPEAYAEKLAAARMLTVNHISARLERRIEWEGHTVLLTGVRPTVTSGGKKPLGFAKDIEPGTAYLGFELGLSLVKRGEDGKPLLDAKGKPRFRPLKLLGETFTVAKWLAKKTGEGENAPHAAESVAKDNIRIHINLADAQRLLDRPGRINAIHALGCRCENRNTLLQIRDDLVVLLPETRAEVPDEPQWFVRERQRQRIEAYAQLVIPILLLVTAAWVGTLSYLNVRQRREEIGLLRAVGVRSGSIAGLFLGKAALFGLLGAAIGFALGTGVALAHGSGIFKLAAKTLQPSWALLPWCLAVAPAMAMLASALPALVAVSMDPAEALRRE